MIINWEKIWSLVEKDNRIIFPDTKEEIQELVRAELASNHIPIPMYALILEKCLMIAERAFEEILSSSYNERELRIAKEALAKIQETVKRQKPQCGAV